MSDLPTSYIGLLDWLSERAGRPGSLVERVDSLASAFVLLATAARRQQLARDLSPLFARLNYLVLNIPAHLSTADERIFIAVLSRIRGEDYSWSEGTRSPAKLTCRVHVLDEDDSARCPPTELVEARWHEVWAAYSAVTRDLAGRGVMTWNQYLLHGCKHPRPLGLAWCAPRNPRAPYYFHIPPALSCDLELPDPADGLKTWNSALARLPSEMPKVTGGDEALVRELQRMVPLDGVDVAATAAAATYHLLRSYAGWGGTAFLSIPVPLAAGVPQGVPERAGEGAFHAALSLCSDTPLGERDLERWRGIAGTVFPYVAASDLVSEFNLKEAELAAADLQAEAWAHDVKNFTAPAYADLMDCRRRLPRETVDPDALGSLERATDAVLILNSAAHARQLAREASRLKRRKGGATPIYALPSDRAVEIVRLAMEYLLETRREQVSQRSAGRFNLRWNRAEITRGQAITELAKLVVPRWDNVHPTLLSSSVLGHPAVVWPVAVLREVVQNIRIIDPIPGFETVMLRYSVEQLEGEVVVRVQQEQVDGKEWKLARVKGFEYANALYGAQGADVGKIDAPVQFTCELSGDVRDRVAFRVRYDLEVRLRVATHREVTK